jgi:hypothetical protein
MSPTDIQPHLVRHQLLPSLDGLLPALQGYPVADLIDVYAQTVAQSPTSINAARHFSLVERCISNWIRTLELMLASYLSCEEEPLKRLRAKQKGARDALLTVRRMLVAAETQRRWDVLAQLRG